MFFTRFTVLGLSLVMTAAAALRLPETWAMALILASGTLSIIGLNDLMQPLHSVRRNYPIIGRLRWFFEAIWTCNGFAPVTDLIMPPLLQTPAG